MHKVIEQIFNKQIELELDNTSFANYLGVSRQWVIRLHDNSIEKRPFRYDIMCKLHNRCGISMEDLHEYNNEFKENNI